MRGLIIIFFWLFGCQYLHAQDPGLEYYAKVPTRFGKPGLSAGQPFRMGWIQTPGNNWLHNSANMRIGLGKIRINTRTYILFSGGAMASYKRQKRELYTIEDYTATEKVNYTFLAPEAGVGVSYGFFFPYFVNARLGFYYPWERAEYTATIPFLSSGSNDIESQDRSMSYTIEAERKLKPVYSLEIYRPFHSHFFDERPMGVYAALNYFPKSIEGSRRGFSIGIYWQAKYKSK